VGDDPVFVLCVGRSGSTLLRFLLDAHPDLACPPETRLPWLCAQLAAAWAVVEDTPPPVNADGKGAVVSAMVAAGLRRSLDPMMAAYLARQGKIRYCDKSLGAARQAGLLCQVWPTTRFLCLYRHPMDVIASGIEASPWGLIGYGFDSYVASPPDNNVAALARYWLDLTTAILAAEDQFEDRCLPVRYEDLVADPEGEAARIFKFIGVDPVPGITDLCFNRERQVFGPADYKIWTTSRISADSAGRGWSVPAHLIPAPLLARINELADVLGYVQVGSSWGIGTRPAALVVQDEAARPGTAADDGAIVLPWARVLGERLSAGMARRNGDSGQRAGESLLLFVTAPAQTGADAWWRVDLATRTVTGGVGACAVDTDWSVTGSAESWQRVLASQVNLGVAFRRGDLRYADKDDAGIGSPGAHHRVVLLAGMLGVTGG
jgi:Sulfotransferase family